MSGKVLNASSPEELMRGAADTRDAEAFVADAERVHREAQAQAARDADDAAQRAREGQRATSGDMRWTPGR